MHGPEPSRARLSTLAQAPHLLRVLLYAAALTAVAAAGCGVVLSHLTLNVTTSLPRGLYLLRSRTPPSRGAIVAFAVPPVIRDVVAARRYLPPAGHLLKRVVALEGDHVCIDGNRYAINHEIVSDIAVTDAAGLPLPQPFPFCGVVPSGVAFVAGAGASSLDSRYFGPVAISNLTTAVPLWTFSSP